jgi:deazaflavin-dependent oxidoreductase (nitroreductase family)
MFAWAWRIKYSSAPAIRRESRPNRYWHKARRTGCRSWGHPVVLFAVTGAKSGQKRYVLLMRVEKGGRYAMIGSIGGSPKNPSWVYNLRANPKVTVQDGDKVFELTAREVDGAERDEWWQNAIEAFPHYAELESLTTRKIPVFVLG